MVESLNCRIYRRTLENVALLWNKKALDSEQIKSVSVSANIDKKDKVLKYMTSDQVGNTMDESITAPSETTVMLINHEKNGLDPYTDYELTLTFGTGDKKKISKIYVYSFGVLPPLEKDDKKSNIHPYGFSEEDRKWAKIPLVKLEDGSYALPVIIVKRDNDD